jgi:hypothetical protein
MAFPVFAPGDVLNASDMNAVGLWLIKTQTIGTTVSSVTVTDAFSADFENYKIVVSGGVASTALGLNLTLGSTATGYYYAQTQAVWAGTVSGNGASNTTSFVAAGIGSTNTLNMHLNVYLPFSTNRTSVEGQYVFTDTTSGLQRSYGGFLNDATSYTAFTLTTSTGTITGGTIRVYGYRN